MVKEYENIVGYKDIDFDTVCVDLTQNRLRVSFKKDGQEVYYQQLTPVHLGDILNFGAVGKIVEPVRTHSIMGYD